jgi:hypothetical protein
MEMKKRKNNSAGLSVKNVRSTENVDEKFESRFASCFFDTFCFMIYTHFILLCNGSKGGIKNSVSSACSIPP